MNRLSLNPSLRGLLTFAAQRITHQACLALGVILACNLTLAQTSDSTTMSSAAVAGQNMQNRLFPQIQLPLTYNFNNKLGANSATKQAEIGFGPIIPIGINDDVQLILNPFLTYNSNKNGQQINNQNQPLQMATFFVPTYAKEWYFGLGPYVQGPASSANNGSMQTGLGLSAAGFYSPEHWVIGVAAYNSWGVGNNLTGGTANVLNFMPMISYTTDNAWTYNFSSDTVYNYDAHATTNQLTLSGGQTFKLFDHHLQWQVGPTYMLTSTPTSAKGWGAYAGITLLLPR